jgi:peptidoglycan DL-endopeptidase CwlO
MSAHRSRRGSAGGRLRPVSDILARVNAGSPASATLQSPRSMLAMAAATAVGAGTAAAAVTGSFPALPSIPGLTETHTHYIIEPTADSTLNTAALNTAAPTTAAPTTAAPTTTAAAMTTPTHFTTPTAAATTTTAPGGTVMAEDLHHTDAHQIASLSHAVSLTNTPTHTSRATSGPSLGGAALPASSSPVGGLLGGVESALSLPSSLSGVPINGPAGSTLAAQALRRAVTRKGLPYVWGATGPSAFDCSGLTQWAYKQLGITLPRTSSAQSQFGTPVSRSQLRPGDLVFFYSPVRHVGIYLGNNKIFNASESGQPLKVSDMSHMPFHNARRIS